MEAKNDAKKKISNFNSKNTTKIFLFWIVDEIRQNFIIAFNGKKKSCFIIWNSGHSVVLVSVTKLGSENEIEYLIVILWYLAELKIIVCLVARLHVKANFSKNTKDTYDKISCYYDTSIW